MMIFDVLLFALAAVIFLRQLMAREAGKTLLWALITSYWAVNALCQRTPCVRISFRGFLGGFNYYGGKENGKTESF